MSKGKYEQELESITGAPDWDITELQNLKTSVDAISAAMTTIASSPGWTGVSADSATDAFVALSKYLNKVSGELDANYKRIANANAAKAQASNAHASLPDASVPDDIAAGINLVLSSPVVAAVAPTFYFAPLGALAVHSAMSEIQNFFDGQREAEAKKALETLQSTVNANKPTAVGTGFDAKPVPNGGSTSDPNQGNGATSRIWPTGGRSGSGSSKGGVKAVPLGIDPGAPQDGSPSGPSQDSNGSGSAPTPGTVTDPSFGPNGPGAVGTGVGGGGLAAGAAGLAAFGASRLGGSGGAGLAGAGTAPGTGGLLGSTAKAASSAAAADEAEQAGARPGSSMMGSPGGSGGKKDQKRPGLGGFIAPKLEDEEERGPRSAAALAGGRDTSTEG